MKGRGVVAAVLMVGVLMIAALAGTVSPAKAATASAAKAASSNHPTWVDPHLLSRAKSAPGATLDVIITSTGGSTGASAAVRGSGFLSHATKNLGLIGGVELNLPARYVAYLQKIPGLIVTPNAPVKLSDAHADDLASLLTNYNVGSSQLWTDVTGNDSLWTGDLLNPSAAPAIAIVDSGVEAGSQFGSRVIASVNLSTLDGNTSPDDQNGHGTFVAGIAAGASPTLTGAAPTAPIVSVKVMDANGTAKTSDVIAGAQWILDHRAQYNIKVANFSMHSSYGTNSYRDPLDQAVEKLWFAGVTVVASSGNYGTANGPSGVLYAPGNDPFVITVGALDTNGTTASSDDGVAPWSAYGKTEDGFSKPEVVAPGRYMIEHVPAGSTLLSEFPNNIQDAAASTLQISGTSFSAPIVSGTVADMLARDPSLTPDQIKGQLMQTARPVPNSAPGAAGVGEITAPVAAHDTALPNPNAGLEQFLTTDASGNTVFNSSAWTAAIVAGDTAWTDTAWTDTAWTDTAWTDTAWTDTAWTDTAWTDTAWTDTAWTDTAWTDTAWTDESAADVAAEDAALGN